MRAWRFLFVLTVMTATNLIAEKPFDFASTPGKLPKNVVPEQYAIRITPDIEKRTFSATETIEGDRTCQKIDSSRRWKK